MTWSSFRGITRSVPFVAVALSAACRPPVAPVPVPLPRALDSARQLLVVITPGWDSTAGTLRRFERTNPAAPWRVVGTPFPVVIGRTGLAWGVGFDQFATAAALAGPAGQDTRGAWTESQHCL